jgi:hypothetical protein
MLRKGYGSKARKARRESVMDGAKNNRLSSFSLPSLNPVFQYLSTVVPGAEFAILTGHEEIGRSEFQFCA